MAKRWCKWFMCPLHYLQVYIVGDRVQAKWEDGKMYFGKVIQVNEGI